MGLKPAQELVGVHDENGKRIFLNENAVFLDWNSARSIGAEVAMRWNWRPFLEEVPRAGDA